MQAQSSKPVRYKDFLIKWYAAPVSRRSVNEMLLAFAEAHNSKLKAKKGA